MGPIIAITMELSEEQERILEIKRRQLEEIRTIFGDKQILTRGQLEAKYEAFSEKYPKTWVSIMDGTLMLGHLERNVEAYETMFRKSRGRTYKERKFNTDSQFGEKLAEEFLYPTFGKPSDSDMNRARNLAKKTDDGKVRVFDKSQMKKLDFDQE